MAKLKGGMALDFSLEKSRIKEEVKYTLFIRIVLRRLYTLDCRY